MDRRSKDSITIKHIDFVDTYLKDFDFERACEKTDVTDNEGRAILARQEIDDIVQKEYAYRVRRLQVTASRTITEISDIAYNDSEGADPRLRLKALEMLCKYQEVLGKEGKGTLGEKLEEKINSIASPEDLMKLGAVLNLNVAVKG